MELVRILSSDPDATDPPDPDNSWAFERPPLRQRRRPPLAWTSLRTPLEITRYFRYVEYLHASRAESHPRALTAIERRITDLDQRLRVVERITGAPSSDAGEPERDSRLAWCEAHLDEIAAYGHSFLAIDATKGVVVHAEDGARFAILIAALPDDVRATILTVHSAQFR